MIKILFFAQLRELLKTSELKLDIVAPCSVSQVKQKIIALHPQWESFISGSALMASVNQELVSDDHMVQAFDEVAFFPPVTGG
ncbi:MAG: molybdopterin synthase sulfur carrier subunit [Oceanicoccus sp.]|jgi:molybdopterin synthase sulfur carrier subunit